MDVLLLHVLIVIKCVEMLFFLNAFFVCVCVCCVCVCVCVPDVRRREEKNATAKRESYELERNVFGISWREREREMYGPPGGVYGN